MTRHLRKRLVAVVAIGAIFGLTVTGTATHAATTQQTPFTASTRSLPLPVSDDLLKLAAGSPASLPVTLITGDKVHLGLSADGKPVVREIEAADRGGARVAFHTFTSDGNVYVVPNDALPLLGSDVLDWGLFDVAKLAALVVAGHVDEVPVLVTYTDKAAVQRAPRTAGAAADRTLKSINGRSMTIEPAGRWWREVRAKTDTDSVSAARSSGPLAGVMKVWLNELIPIALDESVPQIGAPVAWARGYDGSGVTVAVLDTGIDATHPDVAGQIVDKVDFTGVAPDAKDGHGHGTHVAATIAGTGAASDGRRKGVAPGAKLLIGKVCDNGGSCPTDAIIAGMEWAAHSEAKIISMSLGGPATDGTDLMSQALNNLSRATGRLFVVAAGNAGPGSGTVGTPGAADEALTVAAVDKQDQMADFSSRGPRVGDGAAKPDIAAPGVAIVAARAAGTAMGTVVDEYYTTASGTSMATPHVSGAAAIVAAKHPGLTGQQLKAFLMSSSIDLGHDLYAQGAGRVDLARAIDPTITATGNLNFGRYAFPHSPVTRTHTYANLTDEPVTLKLSTSVSAGGQAAPAGLFSLSADEVVVPAQGTVDVTVTMDGGVLGDAGPYGGYSGLLSAHDTTGSLRAVSRVSAFLEPVRFELTVNVIPPDGSKSVTYGNAAFVPVDDKVHLHDDPITVPGGSTFSASLFGGTFTTTVPVSWVDSSGRVNHAVPLVPEVTLTKPTTVTLDLRKAKPVVVQGLPATETYDSIVRFERLSATGAWGMSSEMPFTYGAYDTRMWALPTGPVTMGTLTHDTFSVMVTPAITMTATGGGTPIDLAARYGTADVSVAGGTQQWEVDEETFTRDIRIPVPRLPGNGNLPVAYGGTGTPANLAEVDIDGKLLLITPTDICDANGCDFAALQERVAAAADADAVGVLVAGPAGMTVLGKPATQRVTCPDGPDSCPAVSPYAALPIVTVSTDAANRLIERLGRAKVKINLDGDANPTIYNLAFNHEGSVPAMPYRVAPEDFDRVEHRLHSDRPGAMSSFVWAQFVNSGPDPAHMDLPKTAMQSTLTTMVLRKDDAISRYALEWRDYVAASVVGGVRAEQQELVLGATNTVHWNTGPNVPGAVRTVRTASGFSVDAALPCAGCRQENTFYPTVYMTSSTGARQAILGIVNDTGFSELFLGINNCEASMCDFALFDASGNEFDRRLERIVFGIGSADPSGPVATLSGGKR